MLPERCFPGLLFLMRLLHSLKMREMFLAALRRRGELSLNASKNLLRTAFSLFVPACNAGEREREKVCLTVSRVGFAITLRGTSANGIFFPNRMIYCKARGLVHPLFRSLLPATKQSRVITLPPLNQLRRKKH